MKLHGKFAWRSVHRSRQGEGWRGKQGSKEAVWEVKALRCLLGCCWPPSISLCKAPHWSGRSPLRPGWGAKGSRHCPALGWPPLLISWRQSEAALAYPHQLPRPTYTTSLKPIPFACDNLFGRGNYTVPPPPLPLRFLFIQMKASRERESTQRSIEKKNYLLPRDYKQTITVHPYQNKKNLTFTYSLSSSLIKIKFSKKIF